MRYAVSLVRFAAPLTLQSTSRAGSGRSPSAPWYYIEKWKCRKPSLTPLSPIPCRLRDKISHTLSLMGFIHHVYSTLFNRQLGVPFSWNALQLDESIYLWLIKKIRKDHTFLRERLQTKGYAAVKIQLLVVQNQQLPEIFGETNKGRPDKRDLTLAEEFAEELMANVNESSNTLYLFHQIKKYRFWKKTQSGTFFCSLLHTITP